jgi:hypothetical protein
MADHNEMAYTTAGGKAAVVLIVALMGYFLT